MLCWSLNIWSWLMCLIDRKRICITVCSRIDLSFRKLKWNRYNSYRIILATCLEYFHRSIFSNSYSYALDVQYKYLPHFFAMLPEKIEYTKGRESKFKVPLFTGDETVVIQLTSLFLTFERIKHYLNLLSQVLDRFKNIIWHYAEFNFAAYLILPFLTFHEFVYLLKIYLLSLNSISSQQIHAILPNISLYGYRLLVGRLILFLNILVNILLFVTVLLSIKTLLLMNTNKYIDVYETIYCRICCKRSFLLSRNNIDDIFWIAPDIVFQLNMFWNFSSLHLNNVPFVIRPN